MGVISELVPPDLPLGPRLAIIDAQIVALLWMIQVRFYGQIAKSLSGERLLALNCNDFLNDPLRTLERVADHFGIPATEADLQLVLESDTFNRYAKSQHMAFDRATRRAHLDWVADLYAKEIEFAMHWAKNLPIWSGLDASLPNELDLGT